MINCLLLCLALTWPVARDIPDHVFITYVIHRDGQPVAGTLDTRYELPDAAAGCWSAVGLYRKISEHEIVWDYQRGTDYFIEHCFTGGYSGPE